MASDEFDVLGVLLGALAVPALPVAAVLQERLAHVATQKGVPSAWDWIEQQAGVSLPDVLRAEMEGHLLAWLAFFRPVSPPDYKRQAATALQHVKDLDDDPAFAAYLPILRQLAQEQQERAQNQLGNVARDKALILKPAVG